MDFITLVVSVPLRGKYRGEVLVVDDEFDNYQVQFPSPCGVNIVAKKIRSCYRVCKILRFPSPCGVNIVAKCFIWCCSP